MPFNDKLEVLMKNKKIENLRKLAIESGIPYTTLRSCVENKNGIDNSRVSTVKGLANYFKCTVDYLIYDDMDDNANSENYSLLDKIDKLNNNDKETVINMIDFLNTKIK